MSQNYDALTDAGTLAGTEVIPAWRDPLGTTNSSRVKTTPAAIKTYIDGVNTAANTAAAGTANTDITAAEYGDGIWHKTVLTFNKTAMFTVGDNANLGVGYKLYTMPAGTIIIDSAYMSVALTAADNAIKTDTPEIGLGTVIASGAVDVLSGTATFENILTAQVAADCNGTATVKTIVNQTLAMEGGDAHTVHLNLADGWADRAAGAAAGAVAAAGTVVLFWRKVA